MTVVVYCDIEVAPKEILNQVDYGRELVSRRDFKTRCRLVFKDAYIARPSEKCTICDKPITESDFKNNSVRVGTSTNAKFYHADCWEKKEPHP